MVEQIDIYGGIEKRNGAGSYIKVNYSAGGEQHRVLLEDTGDIDTCSGLQELFARTYCGDMYDSEYFNISGLTYDVSGCQDFPEALTLRTSGSIQCCAGDMVCDDGS